MAIRFQCSSCHAKLKVGSHKAGARKNCPLCGAEILIPGVESSRGETPSASSVDPSDPSGSAALPLDSAAAQAAPDDDEDRYLDAPVIDVSTVRVDRASMPIGPHRADPPLTMPRRAVYALGGLIVVVASFFFVFGVMVGRISVRRGETSVAARPTRTRCVVTGAVMRRENNQLVPDSGSLVLLVPVDSQPDVRPNGASFHPSDGDGADSADAALIRTFGGEVLEVDDQGRFRATVAGGRSYDLLVVSKNVADDDPVSRQLRATWGKLFVPLEPVVDGRAVAMRTIETAGGSTTVPPITFD